ncbi:MAG: cell division protein ZapA [Acidobacteria bacterium]|nr:cell division protein ZapA [Acidobacteriota bacterium]
MTANRAARSCGAASNRCSTGSNRSNSPDEGRRMRSLRGVQVQIFGQVYNVRSASDPDRTHRVAEIVDEKMNGIADRGGSPDSYRVAVLAALELADELLRLRDEHERYRGRINAKRDRIQALLEEAGGSRTAALFPAAD